MGKHKSRPPRFRDIWVNQTELGQHFGLSAVAVGKKLIEAGLRTEQKEPTELAKTEGYCRFSPMKDGTPFYLWHKEKVAAIFRQEGINQFSQEEVEARNTAKELIDLAKQADETGIDKLLYFFIGEIPQREYPLIDRFLRELGSDLRLGLDEKPLDVAVPNKMPESQEQEKANRMQYQYKINYIFNVIVLCALLTACTVNIGSNSYGGGAAPCQSNCTIGSGVQGVQVFVEPDTGHQLIVNAIAEAQQSVWVEMYLLTERTIINALEAAAHRGLDVRVMLESHPYGSSGTISPTQTLDRLRAAGVKAQETSPDFALTHEKGMILDGNTVYIMTANFTRSALGGTSSVTNREYGIIDTKQQDVQAAQAIFNADWNRTSAQFDDPNLVVSPLNARNDFTALINNAHKTLLIEAEEMQDNGIEQALVHAAQRGVRVQVILPSPGNSSSDSNSSGISVIKQGGVMVKEDVRLYMHAKIIVVDGYMAFVGSENISTASLDRNRELGIIVSDPAVLNTLQQTFQQDWNDSQNA